MARSPFDVSGSTSEIAPVQLRGGFSPTDLVGAVADVAQQVIPAITENKRESITNEVTGQTEDVKLFLQAVRFPTLNRSEFAAEALSNPNVRQALQEFQEVQDASDQGVLPSQFALERLELIQNTAIRNSPEFEQEIRAAVSDVTGVDARKTIFSRLLKDVAKTKSPQQVAQEKLEIQSVETGLSVATLIQINQQNLIAGTKQQMLNVSKAQGNYDINMLGGEVRTRSALIMADVMNNSLKIITKQGSLFDKDKRTIEEQLTIAVTSAQNQLIADSKGLNISGTQLDAQLAPLLTMQKNVIAMLDDNTLGEILATHNETVANAYANSIQSMPNIGAFYAVFGKSAVIDALTFSQKSGGTPEGKALIRALDPKADVFGSIGTTIQDLTSQILQGGARVGTGFVPEMQAERNAMSLAAGIGMGSPKVSDDVFDQSVTSIIQVNGEQGESLAWSTFDSNKVLKNVSASTKKQRTFINMFNTSSASLSRDYEELIASGEADIKIVEGEAVPVLSPAQQAEGANRPSGVGRSAKATAFAKQFNFNVGIAEKYKGIGVLPEAKYTSPESYFNDITQPPEALVDNKPVKNTQKDSS